VGEGQKNVPKLRFKGYEDAWEQRKLGTAIDVKSGKDYKHLDEGDVPVYGTGGYMLSVSEALENTRDAIGIGRKGTIDKPFVLKAPFWTVDTLFYCIPKENNSLSFLYSLFQSINWKLYDESTGVPSLSKTAIDGVTIKLTSEDEQSSIGECFESVDNLITLHQRKYDALKSMKKTLLSKMFPKNGEDVPEIRFKGFTDAWEQRKFGNIIQIERGGSPRPIEEYITTSSDGLNWVKIGDAPDQGNYITSTSEKIRPEGLSKTREVYPGDLILSNSMSFGKPYIMAIKGCIHDGWLLLRDKNNYFDLIFLCNLLGTPQMLQQYKGLAAGSTVNNLNKELVSSTQVCIPNIEEQKPIGIFFETIDNLITLHQRKLEELKNMKKTLLQQMFV
jgi:type I restriction enzyme S subunit